MGLTLHYTLRARPDCDAAEALRIVTAAREAALALKHAGRIDAVSRLQRGTKDFFWLSGWLMVPVPDQENTSRGIEIPVAEGHTFTVTLGEGGEPMQLGLCRYPSHVRDPQTGKTLATRRGGWRLSGSCKTQYAGLHGWENFARCHVAAVDLLTSWRALGVRVIVNDEGGYWPRRSLPTLRRHLDRMNGLVAALGGALKDVADDTGAPPVQSPIFAHPHFERLEAAGATAHAAQLAQALKIPCKTTGA